MKKLLFLLVLLVGAVGIYGYLNPGAVPWLQTWLAKTSLSEGPTTTLYRWQDEGGGWHVTDEPPPAGIEYERLQYRHDTNILPPPPDPDEE